MVRNERLRDDVVDRELGIQGFVRILVDDLHMPAQLSNAPTSHRPGCQIVPITDLGQVRPHFKGLDRKSSCPEDSFNLGLELLDFGLARAGLRRLLGLQLPSQLFSFVPHVGQFEFGQPALFLLESALQSIDIVCVIRCVGLDMAAHRSDLTLEPPRRSPRFPGAEPPRLRADRLVLCLLQLLLKAIELSGAGDREPWPEIAHDLDSFLIFRHEPADRGVPMFEEGLLAVIEDSNRPLEPLPMCLGSRAATRASSGLNLLPETMESGPFGPRPLHFGGLRVREKRFYLSETLLHRDDLVPHFVRDVEKDIAIRWLVQPEECFPGGRLPASRFADQTENFAPVHVKGNPVHGSNVLRLFAQEPGNQADADVKPDPQVPYPKKRSQWLASARRGSEMARGKVARPGLVKRRLLHGAYGEGERASRVGPATLRRPRRAGRRSRGPWRGGPCP